MKSKAIFVMNTSASDRINVKFEWTPNSPNNAFDCLNSDALEGQCPPSWDDVFCWPATDPGRVLFIPCSTALYVMGVPTSHQKIHYTNANAFRICSNSGDWVWGNWTNYTQCMSVLENSEKSPQLVIYILFIGSITSLVLLAISLFLLFFFKTLECPRIRVHRNLMISLVVHALSLLFLSSPHVIGGIFSSLIKVSWLCKVILCVKMYSSLSSINWMFIEGLMLNQRLTTKIFDQKFPFKVYYVIGWGVPLAVITTWASLLARFHDGHCWEGYGDQYFVWIIIVPMIFVLLVNCVFLINIIRVLTLKLKRNKELKSNGSQPVEMSKIKAIKATLLLFPLLGTTHLLFLVNPKDSKYEVYYMHFNAWLQSCQGIFVSILYCFMSSDVRRTLRNAYNRTNTRRGLITSRASYKSKENKMEGSKKVAKRSEALNSFEMDGLKLASRKSSSLNGQQKVSIESTRLLPVHKTCCVSIDDLQIKTTIVNSNSSDADNVNEDQ